MPSQLSKDEYNALLHAMWRIDTIIRQHDGDATVNLDKLNRDRKALENLFVRI